MSLTPPPLREFHVFLASPGDVDAERQQVLQFFERFDRGMASNWSVRFEVVDWENYATIGVGRPQELITRQTLDRFCSSLVLVIGIMGQRFGSPTGVAESGTEEELNWAVESHQARGYRFAHPAPPPACPAGNRGLSARVATVRAPCSPAGLPGRMPRLLRFRSLPAFDTCLGHIPARTIASGPLQWWNRRSTWLCSLYVESVLDDVPFPGLSLLPGLRLAPHEDQPVLQADRPPVHHPLQNRRRLGRLVLVSPVRRKVGLTLREVTLLAPRLAKNA